MNELLIKALVLFTAVPVHECAHAWVATKLGDETPRLQGRVTLNPFAHLTIWGSLMMVLVGFGYGKPVAVDMRNFGKKEKTTIVDPEGRPVSCTFVHQDLKYQKRCMAIVALAGPVSNLVMSYLSMIVYKSLMYYAYSTVLATNDTTKYTDIAIVANVFLYMTIINIGLAVFNFLPVPPLDGSKIFGALFPEKFYMKMLRYENVIALVVIVLVFSGLLDTPLSTMQSYVINVMDELTAWIDKIAISLMGVSV